jgi:hypothetical protein
MKRTRKVICNGNKDTIKTHYCDVVGCAQNNVQNQYQESTHMVTKV